MVLMRNNMGFITSFLNELQSKRLIKSINRLDNVFYDEPKIFFLFCNYRRYK